MFLIILLYIICASMFTISKWALAYTEPIFFVAVRMICAGLLLGGYLVFRELYLKNRAATWMTSLKQFWSDWGLFAQIVLFHIYLTYICDLCALKSLSSIESAFIYNISPFISALFSYFWFGEIMTPKKWLGLLLGFGSLLPEFYHAGIANMITLNGPRLITLVAVISSAYGWIVLRALVKKGYSSIFVNSVGMFLGGLIALATSWFTESWSPSPVTHWVPFIQATILIIVVANIIFYNLYGYLLKQYTATFLAFAGFMCPFFAAFLGRIFLSETLSLHLIFSFIIVCVGLALFYHEELRQGYIKS